MAPRYEFTTTWRVTGAITEVADVLADPLDLPRWWPSVYLSATELAPPGPTGVGRRVRLHTRGWLPYTLRWDSRGGAHQLPARVRDRATGDFDGSGEWTFTARGAEVDVRFDWRINANKPLLRYLSFAFRPVFAANHRWAMRQGEASLRRELERRRQVAGGEGSGRE